jgi:2-phospho-L-lactate/phosphoenolpyruvate guanylyltransferase
VSAALRTAAVLPVKHLDAAKQRLAASLTPGTRRVVMESMVTDVLVALRRSKEIDQVLVVTGENSIEALAHGYDADVIPDPEDRSHSDAARRGVREAMARGVKRVLLVPGDCPALDPKEVDALLDRHRSAGVVVVPDRHGSGTNALLLQPPDAIHPAFGAGSKERHVTAATVAGHPVVVDEVPSLAMDVDTAEDLDALRDFLAGRHGGAAHMRGMLSRLGRM